MRNLQDGTARTLDMEDGGNTVSAIMANFEWDERPVGNPLAYPYWATFMKQDNP